MDGPLQDFLSSLNALISTNESTRIITVHVIYNLAYTYKFQLKTTYVIYCVLNITAISSPSFQAHFLIHLHFNEVYVVRF